MGEPVYTPAPADADAEKAYIRIGKIAREFGLIVQAFGGVMTVATPVEQRDRSGLRERILKTHRMTETGDQIRHD